MSKLLTGSLDDEKHQPGSLHNPGNSPRSWFLPVSSRRLRSSTTPFSSKSLKVTSISSKRRWMDCDTQTNRQHSAIYSFSVHISLPLSVQQKGFEWFYFLLQTQWQFNATVIALLQAQLNEHTPSCWSGRLPGTAGTWPAAARSTITSGVDRKKRPFTTKSAPLWHWHCFVTSIDFFIWGEELQHCTATSLRWFGTRRSEVRPEWALTCVNQWQWSQ